MVGAGVGDRAVACRPLYDHVERGQPGIDTPRIDLDPTKADGADRVPMRYSTAR